MRRREPDARDRLDGSPYDGNATWRDACVRPLRRSRSTNMKSIRAKETTSARWAVGALMTAQPFTIGRRETLETAHRLMREHRIRHLPVLERGELIGIVSQRDLYFLETIRGVDLEKDVVEDAMTTETYTVAPDTPIGAVAKNMARHRYGCAVVLERGKVAGIFTMTDALRLVSALAPSAPSPLISAGRATAVLET